MQDMQACSLMCVVHRHRAYLSPFPNAVSLGMDGPLLLTWHGLPRSYGGGMLVPVRQIPFLLL